MANKLLPNDLLPNKFIPMIQDTKQVFLKTSLINNVNFVYPFFILLFYQI